MAEDVMDGLPGFRATPKRDAAGRVDRAGDARAEQRRSRARRVARRQFRDLGTTIGSAMSISGWS